MAIMTHAKFHFNWLMFTSILGIWASEPPPGPDRVKFHLCRIYLVESVTDDYAKDDGPREF